MLLHSQHGFCRHNSRRNLLQLNLGRLPAIVFRFRTCNRCRWGVLHHTNRCTCHHHREYCSNYVSTGITEIILHRSTCWWKPRSHWRPHMASRATQIFCVKAHAPHAPSSAPSWRHLWRHQCHVSPSLRQHLVIYWCQRHVISTDHWPRWLWPLTGPLTLTRPLTLIVDFSLRLTFAV